MKRQGIGTRAGRYGAWALVVWGALCLGAITGCGDDDGDTNNNTAVDAAVDAAPDAATGESITFIVVDLDRMSSPTATIVPIEGAMVALDLPSGERLEASSGANGLVTFHGIDWSAGPISYTGFKFGFSLLSTVNAHESFVYNPSLMVDGYPVIGLIRIEPEEIEYAELRGDFTGLTDDSHNVYLQQTRTNMADDFWGAGNEMYYLRVPTGMDFTLVGFEGLFEELPSGQGRKFEVFRMMYVDMNALSGSQNDVTLDFEANGATMVTADASMFLPTRADSPLRNGESFAAVQSDNSRGSHGIYSYLDISADGNHFDVSLVWVEPPLLEGVFSAYQVDDTGTGAFSSARQPGYPQAGTLDPPLVDTPRVITPANPTSGHPVHATVEFEVFDGPHEVVGLLVRSDELILWRVFAPGSDTAITLPAAPSLVNEQGMLGSDCTGQVIVGTGASDNPFYFSRIAGSESFDIAP